MYFFSDASSSINEMKKFRVKNKRKDAFYFYNLQFEEKDKGQTFYKGINDSAAYDSWMRMTLQQREPFESLAKEEKALRQQKVNNPKDTLAKIKEKEYAEIAKTVNEIVIQSFFNNTYKTQEYYLIAANVFCHTISNKYYPAELALMKFTLQDGFIEAFHTLINPKSIPIGYGFDATCHSKETHLLPIPPNAIGETNYALIVQEIKQWIGKASEGFPLFTLEENIPMIESIIQQFCLAANTPCPYKVLPVNQLFFDLKEQVAIRNSDLSLRFKNIDEATEQLNSDKHLFLQQIACQYHDEKDRSQFCSLSAVKRWTFAISENICSDLQIPLVADNHFPTKIASRSWIVYDYEYDNEPESDSNESSFDDPDETLNAVEETYKENDLKSNMSTNYSYLEDQRVNDLLNSNLGSLQLQEREKVGGKGRGRGRKIQ